VSGERDDLSLAIDEAMAAGVSRTYIIGVLEEAAKKSPTCDTATRTLQAAVGKAPRELSA
jgi:hypothetical protein